MDWKEKIKEMLKGRLDLNKLHANDFKKVKSEVILPTLDEFKTLIAYYNLEVRIKEYDYRITA